MIVNNVIQSYLEEDSCPRRAEVEMAFLVTAKEQ